MALFPIALDKIQLSSVAPAGTDVFRNGLRWLADGSAVRAATSGGAQYSNGLLLSATGQVIYYDATGGLQAGYQFVDGLPLGPTGALCISTGTAVSYSSGLPFVSNGAVAAAVL